MKRVLPREGPQQPLSRRVLGSGKPLERRQWSKPTGTRPVRRGLWGWQSQREILSRMAPVSISILEGEKIVSLDATEPKQAKQGERAALFEHCGP